MIGAGGSFETNESLGLILRSQVAATAGSRLVNTNRARASIGAGLAVNREQGLDTDPTENLEGLTTFRLAYFQSRSPEDERRHQLSVYPSLSNWGRQRIQLDSGAKRELWKDVFLSVNVFDTFDSRPPNTSAERNDVGVVLSFGWSY